MLLEDYEGGAVAKWSKALLENEKVNENQKIPPAWAIFINKRLRSHLLENALNESSPSK